MTAFDRAWDLLKYDPHTHLCRNCGIEIYHHLQQGQGDGTHPPQEVWSNDDGEGDCSTPSGFCEPGESLGKTYQCGEPIEATPESHPNRVLVNGRWVNWIDFTGEHGDELAANIDPESGQPIANWNRAWEIAE